LASIKIYTKTGDKGTTALVDGQRISKSHLRLDAYGAIDELNSHIGVLISLIDASLFEKDLLFLRKTQNHLFNMGSQLANTDPTIAQQLPSISDHFIVSIEAEIDDMSKKLPELKNFILPGGTLAAAQAHVVRTVCRRAERECCRLNELTEINANIIPYINRLSDYFFVLSRHLNTHCGVHDITWSP